MIKMLIFIKIIFTRFKWYTQLYVYPYFTILVTIRESGLVCGMWYVVCGVWCVVRGVWCGI